MVTCIAARSGKGVSRDDPETERVAVPVGEARNFAPGQLRASSRPALWPACEVLAALAPGTVIPGSAARGWAEGFALWRAPWSAERRAVLRKDRCRTRWCGSKTFAPTGAPLPSRSLRMILVRKPVTTFRDHAWKGLFLSWLGMTRVQRRRENGAHPSPLSRGRMN